ncbi:MAG TPA: KTSC domain-containing protein [Opitutaceae bacterium]|nr:KTSC domain-containing protein [Opitutaceae bacterium]HRJ47363.1 KTSC domain-containing protein [Opitutaceae bacterium]
MNSSAIADVAYDPSSRTLQITFRSGGTYTFHGVPADIYRGLITASSPGSFYHNHIRGRFR